MCRRIICKRCNRPSWAGCGAHIEQVLGDVPKAQRCQCGNAPKKGCAICFRSRAKTQLVVSPPQTLTRIGRRSIKRQAHPVGSLIQQESAPMTSTACRRVPHRPRRCPTQKYRLSVRHPRLGYRCQCRLRPIQAGHRDLAQCS